MAFDSSLALGERGKAAARTEPSSYRWRMIAVLWFVVAVVVALPSVGSGVLNARMLTELGFDHGLYGMAFGLFVMMMGVPGPLVAAGIRRYGVKAVMLCGTAMVMTGATLIGTVVREGWHFQLAFGLLLGGGVAMAGVLPAQAAVTHWFQDKRALALSIVLSAIDIGGIAAAPLLEWVVTGRDWRLGWLVIAALAAVGMLAVALFLRAESGYAVDAPPVEHLSHVHKTTRDWTLHEIIRTRAFWFIAIFNLAVGLSWILLMAHGVVHLRDLGFSSGQAAQTVALMVSASLAGNIIAGSLGDRVPPHRIGAFTIALMVVGMFLAAHPNGSLGLIAFALPAGFAYGASQVCLMALLGNYFGHRAFPSVFGLLLAMGTIAAAALAATAGVVFEQIGTYTPVFYVCAAITGIATLAIAMASPPRANPITA